MNGRLDPQQQQQHFMNQRQSVSEYYHHTGHLPAMQQQQYDYMPYQQEQGATPWPSQFNTSHMNMHQQQQQHRQPQQRQQQQQHQFIKSESVYNCMVKSEPFQQQQQQQMLDASRPPAKKMKSGNNFFYDNNFASDGQTDEINSLGINRSSPAATSGAGRLPPMPQFGFASSASTSSSSSTNEQSFGQTSPASPNFLQFSPLSDMKPVKTSSNTHRQTEQTKEKKKSRAATKRMLNRFNGMTEEEVAQRGLPDYLREGLDIVFIGINPSMFAAYTGRYYDGPGNHFWQALHLAGLVPTPMSADDDHRMLDLGIGFTNIVARTTRGLSDLSRAEIADGAKILREKLMSYKPKIAVFNGKAIYEVYSGQKKFMFGRQPEPVVAPDTGDKTWLWVMPSSSARCAQLPRAIDKVPFFDALRKFRDHLTGKLTQLDTSEVVFANVSLRNQPRKLKTEMEQQQHQQHYLSPIKHEAMDGHQARADWPDDYSVLDQVSDGTPAKVPRSVDDVIDYVIEKYGSTSPLQQQQQFGTSSDDQEDDNDLDFKDEDSNGIGDMNFKAECEDQSS